MTKIQNFKRFGYWILEFGYCLELVICDLEFYAT